MNVKPVILIRKHSFQIISRNNFARSFDLVVENPWVKQHSVGKPHQDIGKLKNQKCFSTTQSKILKSKGVKKKKTKKKMSFGVFAISGEYFNKLSEVAFQTL